MHVKVFWGAFSGGCVQSLFSAGITIFFQSPERVKGRRKCGDGMVWTIGPKTVDKSQKGVIVFLKKHEFLT